MSSTLTDHQYLIQAEAALAAIERCCDRLNELPQVDVDNQRVGAMVTLTFRNQSQIVINLQKPLQEIWLAARAGGFHYQLNMEQQTWLDTKRGSELFADLSRYASEQAGMPLCFDDGAGC